jgi:hypothetical protein
LSYVLLHHRHQPDSLQAEFQVLVLAVAWQLLFQVAAADVVETDNPSDDNSR